MAEPEKVKGKIGGLGWIGYGIIAILVLGALETGISYLLESGERAEAQKEIDTNTETLLDSKQCAGCDLRDADFSGVDLSGADLSGADLSNAKLDGTNLTGANLTDTNFAGASLAGANLTDASVANLATTIAAATLDEQTTLPNGSTYMARDVLASVCVDGSAFAGATPYDPFSDAMLVTAFEKTAPDGSFEIQDAIPDDARKAADASSTSLVLCVDRSQEPEVVENCEYDFDGRNFVVNRYQRQITLTLLEASTGQAIESTTEPFDTTECSMVASVSGAGLARGERDMFGDEEVENQAIQEWLKSRVQP